MYFRKIKKKKVEQQKKNVKRDKKRISCDLFANVFVLYSRYLIGTCTLSTYKSVGKKKLFSQILHL